MLLHVAQALQDDLDRAAPKGIVRVRLQDTETPNGICELGLSWLIPATDDPGRVVVVLAYDGAATPLMLTANHDTSAHDQGKDDMHDMPWQKHVSTQSLHATVNGG